MGTDRLTDEHSEDGQALEDYSLNHSVFNFHMPKDFVPLYLPSVFDPM